MWDQNWWNFTVFCKGLCSITDGHVSTHTHIHIHKQWLPEGCTKSYIHDNRTSTLMYYTHSSSLSLHVHPLKPKISCHSWGFSETCSPFHLIGHEKWMTNINNDCHYVIMCVQDLRVFVWREREGLCVCVSWHLCMETGKRKLKVFYLFLSLIAKITVYFQTVPRCGELAWLSRTPTQNWERERSGETKRNKQWRKERRWVFLSEHHFQKIITENGWRKTEKKGEIQLHQPHVLPLLF